ncbi:maleylpyruvate isomerase family mycothiol-dependent enzyme [Goekera deserti]|uniref:Maleylpyruvate isomerase family mycothiol-dependent enzyme n=1 Tax=Goekera deserti TaxID=2497753 RepID=A0A7K3WJ35_9ACTN|nr:maleylpyruvate isomerase family mycothiol-dependent enzyme [Goekera deserti]NDI47069.1 maleylpyruvate isomerase family mycothiol-dependent enzyme [Goekera deserti]NEL55533.1 maleylpyruvate isomerase family mycothiol-dependent enzyme [Goekera deserti]
MSAFVDQIIVSLRHHHDQLVEVIDGLDDGQLVEPSGASEWRICDVLSHLGSGSEIMLRPLAAATGTEVPEGDNQAVWDRWNAMAPREQAQGYVDHGAVLVEVLESLTPEQRDAVTIRRPRLPEPVPLEVAAGMRLNEVAQHTWDVTVGLDPAATVDATAAGLMLTLLSDQLSFMLDVTAEPDALSEPTEVAAGDWSLVIDQSVRLVPAGTNPLVTFTGTTESFYRLLGGRLAEPYTPAGTEVTGSVTLDDLRRVFPGF